MASMKLSLFDDRRSLRRWMLRDRALTRIGGQLITKIRVSPDNEDDGEEEREKERTQTGTKVRIDTVYDRRE
jgi:hypothetical protein